MFNYLSNKETDYIHNFEKLHDKRYGCDDIFKHFLENLNFYFNYLWIPFSPISFSDEVIAIYKENLLDDGILLLSPFLGMGNLLMRTDTDILEWIITALMVTMFVVIALLDMAFLAFFFILGFVTRSLSTVCEMLYYQFTDVSQQPILETSLDNR